jgi:hypothetical protein
VRGSSALLAAFKRFASAFASAFISSHVLKFLLPFVTACPVLRDKAATPLNPRAAPSIANFLVLFFKYLKPFPRAYSGGAPFLVFSLSLFFLSDFDKVSSLVGLVSSNLLAVSCKFIEVLDLGGDDGDDDGNDENDETDCVGDVFDVFDDCEKFDE